MTSGGYDDPAAQLAPYLRPGERLLWSGRPDPDVRFAPADAFLVPFSVMWCGFFLFFEVDALRSGGQRFFVLWGVPFVVAGIYFVYGRFVYKRRLKLRTAYGVTSNRALVALGDTSLHDSPLKHVPTSVRRFRDGSHASVTFGNPPGDFISRAYANTGMEFFGRGSPPVAFYDVADVQALLAALERATAD